VEQNVSSAKSSRVEQDSRPAYHPGSLFYRSQESAM
jgi:hypothetical protein